MGTSMLRPAGLPAALALLHALAAGCGGGAGAPDAAIGDAAADARGPLALVEDPELILDPTGTTPLAARLTLVSNTPSTVTVEVNGGDEGPWSLGFDEPAAAHVLPLLGFRADTSYQLTVTLTGADDSSDILELAGPLLLVTDPLPDRFPELVVQTSVPARMEPGLNLFDVTGPRYYIVIVDAAGEVVWFQTLPAPAAEVRQLDNGNLLYLASGTIVESDLLGNAVRRYRVIAPGGNPGDAIAVEDPGGGFHHDVHPTPMGTLISIGTERTEVEGFHLSETDPDLLGTAEVTDDTIVEFDAEGTVVNRWALLDILDPGRIGYGSLSGQNDWAHSNAVIYDPLADLVIVSARHQDAVFAFRRDTGALVWILAPHASWSEAFQPYLLEPIGAPFEWSYHQHAPQLTPDGTLMLFDNGNFRASPFDGTTPMTAAESYSRAVEYRIDTGAMTVEQVWEYGASIDPRLYADFISDADHLPQTGNVWITFGGLQAVGDVPNADLGLGHLQAQLIEVARDAPDEVVFQLDVFSHRADVAGGWRVYRADRIPGLYRP